MRALREFRYQDFAQHKVVTIPAGAELNTAALASLTANRVDVEKMVRTKYMDVEQLAVSSPPVVPPKRRGRPPKTAA